MKKFMFVFALLFAALFSTGVPVQAQDELVMRGSYSDFPILVLHPNEWLRESYYVWTDPQYWDQSYIITIQPWRYSAPIELGLDEFGFYPTDSYWLRHWGQLIEQDTISGGDIYQLDWNDSGVYLDLHWTHLSGIAYQNTMLPGTITSHSGSIQVSIRFDSLQYPVTFNSSFLQMIDVVDGIWGDVNRNGVCDTVDARLYFEALAYYGAYHPQVRYNLMHDVNLAPGGIPFNEPSAVGSYMVWLFATNPTDPLVADQPYNLSMYNNPLDIEDVPAEPALVNNTLIVNTQATAVMVHGWLDDGTIWQQSDWVLNGIVSFYNVPEELELQNIHIETVLINGIMDAKVPPNWRDHPLPENYLLKGNYPNPFNPSTTIDFELPRAQTVKLAVYNISGQKVAELVNGQLTAGKHTVRFDGSQHSSGVYLYRLEAVSYVDTKKMILVK